MFGQILIANSPTVKNLYACRSATKILLALLQVNHCSNDIVLPPTGCRDQQPSLSPCIQPANSPTQPTTWSRRQQSQTPHGSHLKPSSRAIARAPSRIASQYRHATTVPRPPQRRGTDADDNNNSTLTATATTTNDDDDDDDDDDEDDDGDERRLRQPTINVEFKQ